MSVPLLTAKLYIPPSRPNLVPRPRLLRQLDDGLRLGHRLTLVSAPLGCSSPWAPSSVTSTTSIFPATQQKAASPIRLAVPLGEPCRI
jgi:hypothetical protein